MSNKQYSNWRQKVKPKAKPTLVDYSEVLLEYLLIRYNQWGLNNIILE